MNHHHYAENGRVSLFITILFAFLGITPSDLEYGLKIFLLLVSAVSGIFAIKYYWLASKEKKLQIVLHKKSIEEKDINEDETSESDEAIKIHKEEQ